MLPSARAYLTGGRSRAVRLTIGALLGGIGLLAGALVPVAVAAIAGHLLVRRWQAALRDREDHQQLRDDVDALRALAAELRSGLPPPEALRVAARGALSATSDGKLVGLRRRMAAAAAIDGLGGDTASVLMADASPGSPAASLAAAWEVCLRTGARLAPPVSRIAQSAAAGLRVSAEAEAALSPARASARMLASLPIAGALLGALSGSGTIRVLLFTGVGQLCLAAGVALDLAGLAWLDRLARAAT